MPPKSSAAIKPKKKATAKPLTKAKPTTKTKPTAKARPTAKKAVAKARTKARIATAAAIKSAQPPSRRIAGTGRTIQKQAQGMIESVKKGVQTGIDAVGELVKKITPDALKSKPPKAGRK